MARTGRPCKLTPARHRVLVEALERGTYRETAARLADVGVSTLYRWLEQGEADHEADEPSAFRELWEAATRAEAVAEDAALAAVRRASEDDWRAAAWYLERKAPDRWGRAVRTPAVTSDGDGPVTFADLAALAERDEDWPAPRPAGVVVSTLRTTSGPGGPSSSLRTPPA